MLKAGPEAGRRPCRPPPAAGGNIHRAAPCDAVQRPFV